MPDINGIPYVESTDLVSGWPTVSQSVAQEVSDQLASKVDYPSGGSDGDALLKSGTGAVWGAAGGLTLIDSDSFTAVSNVTFNSCFSADFDNYAISIGVTGSTSASLNLRLRASGTDETANSYVRQRIIGNNTTVSADRVTSTSLDIQPLRTNFISSFVTLGGPFLSAVTKTETLNSDYSGGTVTTLLGTTNWGVLNTTTSYDGITFLTSSGTMTGTISIYGLRK